MNHHSVEELVSSIKEILLTERALLTRGQAFEALALKEEKSIAIQKFEEFLETPEVASMAAKLRNHVKNISQIAKENELHFLAIRNGFKSLTTRLESIDVSARAGVYNQHGREIRFTGATGSYLKKV